MPRTSNTTSKTLPTSHTESDKKKELGHSRRIGIDGRLMFQTGVGTYTRNLIYNLASIITNDEVFIFMRDQDIERLDQTNTNFENKQFKIVTADYQWHSFSEQIGFLRLLKTYNLDLMHFTYFSFPVLYNRPYVITIHDITPLLYKTGKASTRSPLVYSIKHAVSEWVYKRALYKADAIITPTHAVKDSLLNYFTSLPEDTNDRIHVTYEGMNKDIIEKSRTSSRKTVKDKTSSGKKSLSDRFTYPFFMYVGNFYPHKNIENLIRAYAEVQTDIKLLLLGPDDHFAQDVRSFIHNHNLQKKIHMYLEPTNTELAFFYKHAEGLIHPSLSEGFGLTLLEASYFGCPIIASDIPVFQEVLDGNFLSFDPNDIYSMASAIQRFLNEPKKAQNLHVSKNDIEKRFSFKHMAEQTYDIYTNI